MLSPNGDKAVVLVADDDPYVQKTLSALLSEQGYRVVLASDGREAQDRLRETPTDLCVLDYDMPGVNGMNLCRQIKADPATCLLPVIMLTGMAPEREKLNALDAGVDEFLTKPVAPAALLAKIRSLLRIKALTDELEDAEVVLFTLARTIEAKDPYTMGHADRVARFGVLLGRALGFGPEKLEMLRKGGILHDIGKLGVPDAILQKQGPLDAREWETMRRHPTMGCEICQRLKGMKEILPIIRHHHERLNGTGYPDGLKGPQIPDVVRVINLVDIYDALTSQRAYKDAFPPAKAFRVMRDEVERGWWDGDFLKVWEDLVQRGVVAEGRI
jgi:putative two-component system response regulator